MSRLHTLHPDPRHDLAIPFSRPGTPRDRSPQIGFLGLGAMGYLMARNLAMSPSSHPAGSPPLLVWNRTVRKSLKLVEELGANRVCIASAPAQMTQCDVIITNLANDEAVKYIYGEFSDALKKTPPTRNKIFVETSTIYPALAGELDKLISAFPHTHLITCPVFGAPSVADKAALLLAMSGDYRSKKEVAPLLVPAIGRKIIDVGGNLEKAPTLKILGTSMMLGSLEILAESLTLAEKSGIGAVNMHNLIKEVLPSPFLIAYGDKMTNDLFDGTKGFAIDGGIKDASHVRRLTAEYDCPMPTIDIAHQHLLTARALHTSQRVQGDSVKFETLDWSAMVASTRVAAGLDGFDCSKHSSNLVAED